MEKDVVWGWEAIAELLGYSRTHAQRLAALDDDRAPPVRKMLGRVFIRRSELADWMRDHSKRVNDACKT